MQYVVPALLALVLVFVLGCARVKGSRASMNGRATIVATAESPGRENIRERLERLHKAPAPTCERFNAMCYAPLGPSTGAEYVCPTCGEKTLYADSSACALVRDLPVCRSAKGTYTGLVVELDESELCSKCSPGVESPRLSLVVRYDDESNPHRVAGVTADDMIVLKAFLEGDDRHRGRDGPDEEPLKDHAGRLGQLLGVTR